jgi:hypothetical protein
LPACLLAGTLIKRLMDGPDAAKLAFSVSHTTRKPREGEVDGIHYHFVSKEDFQEGISGGCTACDEGIRPILMSDDFTAKYRSVPAVVISLNSARVVRPFTNAQPMHTSKQGLTTQLVSGDGQ